MHIRTALPEDGAKIKRLYIEVSRAGGALARSEEEVTDEFISDLITNSIATGLIIVAEHPDDQEQLIGMVYGYKMGPKIFNHVLSNITIAVHPEFQGKKVGRTIFTIFLEEIGRHRADIGKVELVTSETNMAAIQLYQSLGFKIEGRMEMRFKSRDGAYLADIPMGWQNPNFEFD